MSNEIQQLVACRFCRIAAGDRLDSETNESWLADDDHFALISIGALVDGWTLIVPRQHSTNMAGALSGEATHRFIASVVARLEAEYGPVVIFEHGCASEGSLTGCGVGHAHLHVVPFSGDLESLSKQYAPEFQWESLQLGEVSSRCGEEYLFVANEYRGIETHVSLVRLASGISQFFRRVIAKSLGREHEFDYKAFAQTDVVLRSLRDLRSKAMAA